MIKRLRKRQHRFHNICKTIKRGPCKCNCKTCTTIKSMNKQRTMDTMDLLDNFAYQNRFTQERPTSMMFSETETNSQNNITEKMKNPRQDNRDLQQSKCDDLPWWNDMTHSVLASPLLHESVTKSTLSECSITSDFHSDRADSPDYYASSKSSTPTSDDSDYKSARDVLVSLPIYSGSKSDPKIPQSMKIKLKSVAKSVSIPLGQRPKKLRGTKIVAKRKLEMKRPVRRTTSHIADCFSNCVKCSKIVSRPYK